MSRIARAVTALVLWMALIPTSTHAQQRRQGPGLPQPKLTSVFPLGVAAGETVDVTVSGTDLEGSSGLWFDHPGLRAFRIKDKVFRVVCATATPLGHHDVRVLGRHGVSNPRAFVVGDRVEKREVEPNNTAAQANPMALGAVVNGELAAADLDCFAIEGRKGDRLFFEVEAERLDSRLDATLRLFDPRGREVAESRDAEGADPFLDITLPSDGRYTLQLHDVTYRGSNEYPYRLLVSDGPHLDAIAPVVAKAGETTTFTLIGRNIGGEPINELSFDGRPLERKSVAWTLPSSCQTDPENPMRSHVSAQSAMRKGFEFVLTTEKGRSNPVFVAEAEDPVVVEREPNDDAKDAQELVLPCDVSGSFGAPGDLDLYRFRAKKGEVWIVEAIAEGIGSPADPSVVIQKVDDKGNTQDLMTGEDQAANRGGQVRLSPGVLDPLLKWTAPEDGMYQVAVYDLFSSQRGDPRLVYRLRIRRERPGFRLFIVPESPNDLDALTLRAGGRAIAYAMAWRNDGFTGPIRVEASGLPPGIHCDPAIIPANQSLAPLVFEVDEDAKPWLGTVHLAGRARFGDRKESLAYVPGTALGPDETGEALAMSVVWGAPNPNIQIPNQQYMARLTRGFVFQVIEPGPLALTVKPLDRAVTAGSLLALDVSVTRRNGFDQAVNVSLASPLPNQNIQVVNQPLPTLGTIASAVTTGTVELVIPKNQASGTYTYLLSGTGQYPFSSDPNAKTKPNVTIAEPSNPISITVRPAPVAIALKPNTGTLKPGGMVELEVTVTRKDGSMDPLEVSLSVPEARKLSAETLTVMPGKAAKLVVKAAADSPVGKAVGAAVRATVIDRGELVFVDEPVTLTIAK